MLGVRTRKNNLQFTYSNKLKLEIKYVPSVHFTLIPVNSKTNPTHKQEICTFKCFSKDMSTAKKKKNGKTISRE